MEAILSLLEQYAPHLAFGGPLLLVILALALKGLRAFIRRSNAQTADPTREVLQEAVERLQDAPEAGPPPGPVADPNVPGPQSYEDQVRAWNKCVEDWERKIQEAHQHAQAWAVENDEPVLLTIYNYYELKDGDPITKVEVLPPHMRGDSEAPISVVVDDQRRMPDEQAGYKFLPRHIREKWAETCRKRREAIEAGSLRYVDAVPPAQPGVGQEAGPSPCVVDNGGRPRLLSKDTVLQDKIDRFRDYRGDLNQRAAAAFAEELPKIKADAEQKAREVMLKRPERAEAIQKEAAERGVDVAVVEEEFVRLVVDQAVKQAEATFRKSYDSPLLDALTKERVVSGNMFTH